ncbi:MAG TPA: twin-arginine translocase TatA/TatE family subunit [Dehalococcoidia bacterium]|nr:twin-arginine translocase TatA/TatE family subunit [Dehalococcoidia bacterium]
MDFVGIGAQEILMILLVAILVIGPNRIVEVGRTIGKVSRAIKKASIDFTSAVSKEMEQEEKDKQPPSIPPPEKKG